MNSADFVTTDGMKYSAETCSVIPVYPDEDENSTDEEEDGTLDGVYAGTEDISQNDKLQWFSKPGRVQWETAFTTRYINPFIEVGFVCALEIRKIVKESMKDKDSVPT